MAIRTGIGVGAAQIFDTSNITNAYARRIAQEQKNQAILAEREAKAAEAAQKKIEKQDELYREELADLIGSIKTEGVRDQDIADITKSYNQIKELYRKGASITDPNQRALFRAELNNGVRALNEYAQRSVKFGKDLFSLGQDIARNEWDYDPSSVSLLKRMNTLSLRELGPEAVLDPMRFKRVPNFGLIDNIIDETYKLGKERAQFAGERFDKGKRFNVDVVDPKLIQSNLINKVQSNPEAFSAVRGLYVRETGDNDITPEKLANFLKDKYESKFGPNGYEYVGEARDLKEPKGGDGDGSGASKKDKLYAQLINSTISGDVKSMKKLESLGGGNYKLMDSPKGSGFIRIKPSEVIKYQTEGGFVVTEKTDGEPIDIPRNSDDLFRILQEFGIRPSGVGSVVNLKYNQTNPAPQVQEEKPTQYKNILETGRENLMKGFKIKKDIKGFN